MRRGSPLPFPNREVKPDCADGTAVMWESMSPPFFSNPSFLSWGYFFIGTPCSQARFAAFLLKSLFKRTGFFVLSKYELKIKGEDFIVLKYNPTKIAVGEVVAPEGTTTQHTTTR